MADARACRGRHHLAMICIGRQHRRPSDDERAFFEAIVAMRSRYAVRGREDALPVTNLHHAIATANAAMKATDTPGARHLGTPNH